MSSRSLIPTNTRQSNLTTPVGVDIGVKHLVAAAPVDGSVASAFTIQGDHIRSRHEILVEAMTALDSAIFDTIDGQRQLFAATWQRFRGQLFDAAVRLVRYARRFNRPILILEDLSACQRSLWEQRTAADVGTWLLPALQEAIITKAAEAGISVRNVNPEYTSQECHNCGNLGHLENETIECTSTDCPVGTVCRDRSAALSIAKRADQADHPTSGGQSHD
jgi:IS605 OrfB family transposase